MKSLQESTLLPYLMLLCILCIVTYSNAVEGNQKQAIYVSTEHANDTQEVHAKMKVHFTPEYFISLLSRTNKNCAWMDNCVSVKVLAHISDTEKLTQTHIAVPWPFKDRDMVVMSRSTVDKSTNTLTISLTDASDSIEPTRGRVRMTQVFGVWLMKPAGNDFYELSYKGSANPNGAIPKSFALKFLQTSTRKTFENLQSIDNKQYNETNK